MLRASLAEYIVSETLCRLPVEDAVALEDAEGIGIQHFCPFVAVIACGIAPCHDVRELHRHARVLQLFAQDGFLPRTFLESRDVGGELVTLCVVCHVQQTETHLSQTGGSCHEVAALHDAAYQFVGQWLACLIMEGEGSEEVLLHGEVLHKLRRQFHEVPPYVGARQRFKAGVGKHAVQRVSELVQEGFHLAQCQQCRLLVGRFRQVHHHTDVRTYVFALLGNPLTLILRHPGTALFTLAGMEIGIEHSQIASVLVEHLVGFHVGMIHRDILVLLERDAIQAVGQSEHTVYHFRQLKIGAQHLGIQVVFLHLQLVRIETCIPWFHPPLLLEGLGEASFQLLQLLDGCGLIGIYEVVQQSVNMADIRCHTALQHVVGVGLIA